MNYTKTILTAVVLGAGYGMVAYLTHGTKPAPTVDDTAAAEQAFWDTDAAYWNRVAAQSVALSVYKDACRTLQGYGYTLNAETFECTKMVDCTSCVVHKGPARNAVIHDNAWHPTKAVGPDYAAMMRQDKLVFQMSMASRAATEAGRQAYDHSIRCSRLTWSADVQCK